ncbi:Trihelix transcription factor GT-4 [Frankliniella fusca]|uniref:Trihelix transcription factor GT-4 n=1 Tax=Frankliniella fusca TaxID=407009 RepID=A0AAE1L9E5_9NEOP|nr:Trihelix transcription factor GT-4 [Frankliniella fusca]
MAQRKANEYWKDEETRALVRLRIAHDKLFTGSKGNSCHGWNRVVIESLRKEGVTREDDKKIKRKWSDECRKYKDLMNPSAHLTGVGTEDGEPVDMDPVVFEILASYHETKHNTNPPALFDTSVPSGRETDALGEHSYSTAKSEYLGNTAAGTSSSCVVPEEYITEIEVPSSVNFAEDDDGDCEVSVKASSSKRCCEFYNKPTEKSKKVKQNNNDEWLKEFLVQSREDRRQDMAQLVTVLEKFAPK